jgi:hypothetical protein
MKRQVQPTPDEERQNLENEWLKYLMDKRAAIKPALKPRPQEPMVNVKQQKAVADGK